MVILLIRFNLFFFFLASSLLNLSYQTTKPCEVLVGENTQIVPASKTAPASETNLSTPTRPKTSSTGGKYPQLVHSRKRRNVLDPQHAFMLKIESTTSSSSTSSSDSTASTDLHDGTSISLHDFMSSTSSSSEGSSESTSETLTNEETTQTTLEEIAYTSTDYSLSTESTASISTIEELPEQSTEENLNYDLASSNEEDVSLFNLNSEEYDDFLKIQRDQPDDDDDDDDSVEIVKLDHGLLSTTQKSKSVYNSNLKTEETKPVKSQDASKELTDANLSMLPVAEDKNLKHIRFNDETVMYNNFTNNKVNLDTNKTVVKVIDLPQSMSHSKKFFVNLTIATDDTNNPYSEQSVYVLSVAVPIQENFHPAVEVSNKEKIKEPIRNSDKSALHHILDSDKDSSGGTCECSCPSLDSTEISDNSSEDSDGHIVIQPLNISTTAPPGISSDYSNSTEVSSSATDFSSTSESWMTNCPEVTTKLPPPPTILILEGRNPALLLSKNNMLSI